MQEKEETRLQSLGQEDLLEKEMATHSNIPAWKIPWTEEPDWLQSMVCQRVRCDWACTSTWQHLYFKLRITILLIKYSPVTQRLKRLPAMRETWVRSLGWEDSPGEGNGNPLQYSCLENLMDGGAWWGTDYWVAKSQTWLSKFTFTSLKILFCFFMFQLPNKSILYFFFFIIPVSEIPTDLQSVSLAGCYLKFSFSSLV